MLHRPKPLLAATTGAPAAPPRSGPLRSVPRARRSRWGFLGAGASLLTLTLLSIASCTLTSDDFEPARVEPQPNLPGAEAPVLPVAPVSCVGGGECCAAAPCVGGQLCSSGRCQPAPPLVDAGACVGEDCPRPAQLAPVVNCADSLFGQGETDTDCGGSCGSTCQVGQRCQSDVDCGAGLSCLSASQRCSPPSCDDGVLNGSERQADCGGGTCPGCADGAACDTDADCLSSVCGADGSCAAPLCNDGVANGSESGVDCGGPCAACGTGARCNTADDCLNGVCLGNGCAPGLALCCQPRSCGDDVRNGTESDVDCGGPCANCATGGRCNGDNDCQSSVCAPGGCGPGVQQCCQAPSCSDGVANGGEPVPDCGNAACGLCALGQVCSASAQCQSGLCQAGRCANAGSCTDGVQNGTETATDCGGDRCPRCGDRLTCTQASDCINNNCFGNVCISCGSGVIDGTETDIDCGGSDPFCLRCVPGARCLIGSDCQSGVCNNTFCG